MGMSQARVTDSVSGHTSFQPIVMDTGSQNVFINSLPQLHQNAVQKQPHPPLSPTVEPPMVMGEGSQTVFINSQGQSRVMDSTICGGFIISGSPDVFIG